MPSHILPTKPSSPLQSVFLSRIVYAFLVYLVQAASPAHVILLVYYHSNVNITIYEVPHHVIYNSELTILFWTQ
jgi:hypothetical protein